MYSTYTVCLRIAPVAVNAGPSFIMLLTNKATYTTEYYQSQSVLNILLNPKQHLK